MTATDFERWMRHMGRTKPLSDTAAGEMLGCSRNTVRGWREGKTPIPRYVGLACAALAFGLPEWR